MLFGVVMRCDDEDTQTHGILFMYLYHMATHEMRLKEASGEKRGGGGRKKGHLFIYLSSFLFRLFLNVVVGQIYLTVTRTPTKKAKYQFRFMFVGWWVGVCVYLF